MKRTLESILRRAEAWPKEAQDELALIAAEMDAEIVGGDYQATPEELLGIDRGLDDARRGLLASGEEIEAAFARRRNA